MKERDKALETLIAINISFLLFFFYFNEKYILKVALALTISCLLSQKLLGWVYWIWTGIFSFVATVNTKILLFIVFFVFLTPIAFLKKIFSKKKNMVDKGNYKTRNHLFTADDLKKMG